MPNKVRVVVEIDGSVRSGRKAIQYIDDWIATRTSSVWAAEPVRRDKGLKVWQRTLELFKHVPTERKRIWMYREPRHNQFRTSRYIQKLASVGLGRKRKPRPRQGALGEAVPVWLSLEALPTPAPVPTVSFANGSRITVNERPLGTAGGRVTSNQWFNTAMGQQPLQEPAQVPPRETARQREIRQARERAALRAEQDRQRIADAQNRFLVADLQRLQREQIARQVQSAADRARTTAERIEQDRRDIETIRLDAINEIIERDPNE